MSTKPGVPTMPDPSRVSSALQAAAISADFPIAANLPSTTAMAASRMMRRSVSTVISQSIPVTMRSARRLASFMPYLLYPASGRIISPGRMPGHGQFPFRISGDSI